MRAITAGALEITARVTYVRTRKRFSAKPRADYYSSLSLFDVLTVRHRERALQRDTVFVTVTAVSDHTISL